MRGKQNNVGKVSREAWRLAAYQDIGDNPFFYTGFEELEKITSLLAELKERGATKEELANALSSLPELSGIVKAWDEDIDFSSLRGFDEALSEGPSWLWFMRLRGGASREILDMDVPQEEPTTDRLFLDTEYESKALDQCASAFRLLRPLLEDKTDESRNINV